MRSDIRSGVIPTQLCIYVYIVIIISTLRVWANVGVEDLCSQRLSRKYPTLDVMYSVVQYSLSGVEKKYKPIY